MYPIARFYLTTTGRISRRSLWIAVVLPLIALTAIAAAIDVLLWPEAEFEFLNNPYSPASFALTVLVLWPSFATAIRRAHDLNMTGWWVLSFIPMSLWAPDFSRLFRGSPTSMGTDALWLGGTIVAVIIVMTQLFIRGIRGENRFGPEPIAI